jgi:putative oxidoreductase
VKLDVALLVLRSSGLGLAVFHGWPKLAGLVSGQSRFVQGVAEMGFPLPAAFAWAAALAETLGGILVFLGLGTRIAAAFCAVTMLVAAFGRHKAWQLFLGKVGLASVTDEQARAWGNPELALVYFACFLALALAGGGGLAVEAMRGRGGKGKSRR